MRQEQRRHHTPRCTAGFTLVEMSIVLVILGLLLGGVLLGRNLIRSSEVQSVATQKESFVRAVTAFRDRYDGLPGDLTTATNIWGAADADFDTCAALTTASAGTETCNGNGDKAISAINDSSVNYERHRAWQHLANAGLIEGTYTGVQGPNGGWHGIPGINAPTSKISGVGWGMFFVGAVEDSTQYYDGVYDHVLFVGKESINATPSIAFLRADEAWGLDTKYDDGKPARGTIVTKWLATNCHDGTGRDDYDAKYKKENTTSDVCPLIFRNVF